MQRPISKASVLHEVDAIHPPGFVIFPESTPYPSTGKPEWRFAFDSGRLQLARHIHMPKKLLILRNESQTFAVHVEFGTPPQIAAGGQSLDRERLATELSQHGCPQLAIEKALTEVESDGVSRISL